MTERRFVTMDWSPGRLNVCPQHTEIMVECTGCGERKPFDRNTVPPAMRDWLIKDLEARLKCGACGKKPGKLLFGYYASSD